MTTRSADPAAAPAALAAFLRGVERRGAVFAELQAGDADTGDAALAEAMREFRGEAVSAAMSTWPVRFWSRLLAQPRLRSRTPVALPLDATDRLGELGGGPRAALLLRLAAGLSESEAAAVLGIAGPSYRLALQRALPRHPDGRADPDAWRRLREQVHHRIKNLPAARLVRLTRAREAALTGATAAPPRAPRPVERARRRWLLPTLWALLALCALGFLATFALPQTDRASRGGPAQLPEEAPAARYAPSAGLIAHRDFELLADPQGEAQARALAFHSWLAAQQDWPTAPLPAADDADARPRPAPASAATGPSETADAPL